MSNIAYQAPADVQLKVVTVNTVLPVKTTTGIAPSKIFTISFSFQKKAYRTKVMKVIYAGGEPMYKLVMPSNLSGSESCIYWLQRTDKQWSVALGNQVDAKLLSAVTSAIDTME